MAEDKDNDSSEITVSKSDLEKYNINKDNPLAFQIIETAFLNLTSTPEGRKLYGDPHKKGGGSLEQIWRTQHLITGKSPVCLFAGTPSVKTNEITPLVKLNPKELVNTLSELLELLESTRGLITISIFDGKQGHVVNLLKRCKETSTFIYVDTWPHTTLLRKGNNIAGVEAKRIGKQLWSINDVELEKVIVAAFVWQNLWAEYNHEKYYVSFNDFKNSDFWSFFNLTEINTQDLKNNKKISLKTGGFQSEIDLSIIVNPYGRLIEGELNVKRNWIIGQPFTLNPFALDIVRSFIFTLTPLLDHPQIASLIQMLDMTSNSEDFNNFIANGPPKSPTIPHIALFVYLGIMEKVDIKMEFSNITLTNFKIKDEMYLQILVKTDEFYLNMYLPRQN